MKSRHLTTIKVIFTIIIAATFILALYATASNKHNMLMACVVIQSICTFAVLILTFSDSDEEPEDDEFSSQEALSDKLMSKDLQNEVSRLKNVVSALTDDNKAVSEKLASSEAQVSELNDTVSNLNAQLQVFEQTSMSKSNSLYNLLPEIPDGSSENVPIDIINIANEVSKELAKEAEKADINVQISSTQSSLFLKADPQRIRIMFRNIVDNSIKYMQRSGVLVITISNIGQDAFIVLKDNGSGLSDAETSHIFELNFQGSNRISGNGLGLAQSKAIVNHYGGIIYAKSNLGSGMGIYIQLPIRG